MHSLPDELVVLFLSSLGHWKDKLQPLALLFLLKQSVWACPLRFMSSPFPTKTAAGFGMAVSYKTEVDDLLGRGLLCCLVSLLSSKGFKLCKTFAEKTVRPCLSIWIWSSYCRSQNRSPSATAYRFSLNTGCIDERSVPDTVTVNEASFVLKVLQITPPTQEI